MKRLVFQKEGRQMHGERGVISLKVLSRSKSTQDPKGENRKRQGGGSEKRRGLGARGIR